jgi:hypothetical protein
MIRKQKLRETDKRKGRSTNIGKEEREEISLTLSPSLSLAAERALSGTIVC